jgi:hypothetical protein
MIVLNINFSLQNRKLNLRKGAISEHFVMSVNLCKSQYIIIFILSLYLQVQHNSTHGVISLQYVLKDMCKCVLSVSGCLI